MVPAGSQTGCRKMTCFSLQEVKEKAILLNPQSCLRRCWFGRQLIDLSWARPHQTQFSLQLEGSSLRVLSSKAWVGRGLVGGAGSQQAGPGAEIRAASDPSPSLGALRSLWVVPGRAVTQPVDSPSEELTASRLSLPTSLLSDSPGRCHCWWGSRGARLRAG